MAEDIAARMERLRRDNVRALARALDARDAPRPARRLRLGRLLIVWTPRRSKTYAKGFDVGLTIAQRDARDQLVQLLDGIEYGYRKAQEDRERG